MKLFLVVGMTMVVGYVAADYGGVRPSQNVIVMPAGLSKAHQWIGVGNYNPIYVPKPFAAPRWIPHRGRTYTASWVPFAPEPRFKDMNYHHSSGGGGIPSGFGHPKGNSVMSLGYSNHPAISVRPVGYHEPINPHQSENSYHGGLVQSQSPLNLQVLDTYAAPQPKIKSTKHARSSFYQQPPTVHIGTPQPGAAPPSALGINYAAPKPDDIVKMFSQLGSSPSFQLPSSNSIKGRNFHFPQSTYSQL